MASNATSSSFYPSSSHPWIYDVFLNFRGTDTRDTFVAHLHGALKQRGFHTFIDDRLQKGEEISPELLKAIEGSRISIVVFSPDYASSSWCLNELLKIIECKEEKGQVVLPVFYHVNPSDIRKHTNSVGDALARFKDDKKVEEWKIALKKVADLSGFHHMKGNENTLIEDVLQQVTKLVQFRCLYVAKNPIGIESRVKDFLKQLDIEKKKNVTRMVGIWGDGGIGKTTIAKVIYNSIAHVFEGACFLADVRETTERFGPKAPSKDGLIKLQSKILSKILGNDTLRIDNVDDGIVEIHRSLHFKKILLILDDVNHLEQLEKLAGKSDWFGLGSVIIITTRDRSLLTRHRWNPKEDFIYKIKKLDRNESLQLFSMNAFKTNKPNNASLELANEVICYARGLPLALTILGSTLCGRKLDFQKEKFEEYRRIPNKDIQTILEFSYNDLDELLKDVFLDIACFFKGMFIEDVKHVLPSCGYSLKLCVEELEDKSFINAESGILEMHDLVQHMGREIVRKESPAVGERSRLWFHEDVRGVLEENVGTSKIKGMLLDLPKKGEILMHPEAFNNLKELRFFINQNAKILGVPQCLSNKLILLKWPEYRGEFMPSNFLGSKLVDVEMPCSQLKSLKNFKSCQNLTRMDFSKCGLLEEIPDFSGIANLEELYMSHCENLISVHPSVGCLQKLVVLGLEGCFNLRRFPTVVKMRSLVTLDLYNCSRLENFPEFQCPMESLLGLYLENTGIEYLPSSFQNLATVASVYLDGCNKLKHFPSGIVPLQFENQGLRSDCSEGIVVDNGQYIEPMKEFKRFDDGHLSLRGTSIVSLPTCIQTFLYVSMISLDDCVKLQEIVVLPRFLQYLRANGCNSLERFSVNVRDLSRLKMLNFKNCHRLCENPANDVDKFILSMMCEQKYLVVAKFETRYPGNEIPSWFTHRKEASGDNSCEIEMNELANLDEKFVGLAFCSTFGIKDSKSARVESSATLAIELISGGVTIAKNLYKEYPNHVMFSMVLLEGLYQLGGLSFDFVMKSEYIKVRFQCLSQSVSLLSCGVHLLRSHEKNSTNRCTLLDRYVLHNGKYVPRKEYASLLTARTAPLLLPPQITEPVKDFPECQKKSLSINGTQLGKRRRDDEGDDSLKSDWHRQHSVGGIVPDNVQPTPAQPISAFPAFPGDLPGCNWFCNAQASQGTSQIFGGTSSGNPMGPTAMMVDLNETEYLDERTLVPYNETERFVPFSNEPFQQADVETQDCFGDIDLHITSDNSALGKFQGASSSSKSVNDKGKAVLATAVGTRKPQQLIIGETPEGLICLMEIPSSQEESLVKEVSKKRQRV